MHTLKQEEIYCRTHASLEQLEEGIEGFIAGYNKVIRLHSALGYKSPAEFEADIVPSQAA